MKKFLLVCALCMSFGIASDALGQGRNSGRRDGIRRGVRSGELTRDEARQLRQRRRQIREERRTYRSDGTLTRDERRDLRRDRRELGRNIRRERRDDDHRGRRRGNGYHRRGAGSPSHPVFGRRNRNQPAGNRRGIEDYAFNEEVQAGSGRAGRLPPAGDDGRRSASIGAAAVNANLP